jgi:hypothetical protein
MKIAPEELNKIINDVAAKWAVDELQYYKERAAKVPQATGRGKSDIAVKVLRATADNISVVSFMFYDYMRYRDMRRLDNKFFPVDEAIRWIEAKGINKFMAKYRRISGGKIPSDSRQLLNSIAWGIVKGQRRHRPKRWYQREKWQGINVLWAKITDRVSDNILQQMKNDLQK